MIAAADSVKSDVLQSALKNLTSLDLLNCGISKLSDYRENIFKLIPSLQVLDGCEKEQGAKGDENGKFLLE